MKPHENSSERLPIETFRKIIYNGFYYIKNNAIFWETNAIFIGNGYSDQMVKTHPVPGFPKAGEFEDAHYWDWGNKDEVWEFKDYGKTWSIDREELEKILKETKKFAVVEKRFEYKGHECICIFNHLGYRCGYVSVDDDVDAEHHMKLDYDDCHCGLTFGGELPYNYGQTREKYIGFDCGHSCDACDFEQAYKYGLITEEERDEFSNDFFYLWANPVRPLDYVEYNCKKLVNQIMRKKNDKSRVGK